MQGWHDFFLLTGGAAATLLGLVFVAASIAATVPNDKLGDARSRGLWVLPIVYAFLRVLMVGALGIVPGQTPRSFGVILAALALPDLARMVRVLFAMRVIHRTREPFSVADWGWYVAYPIASTAALALTGLSLAFDWNLPVQLLAAGILGHLVIGVHNAWELADWLATRQ